MEERIILITGSTDGIGKQTVLELGGLGGTLIIHGRTEERCRNAHAEIMEKSGNNKIAWDKADLGSFAQIKTLSENVHNRYSRLDILINNAGVFEKSFRLSEDGFEMTFAVNHLATFLITGLLLDLLRESPYGRIINVSSKAHGNYIDFNNLQGERGFDPHEAYSVSKLCNILFTYELAERIKENGITVNCLHPGVIDTKLLRSGWSGGLSVSEGGKTSVYLAASPEVSGITGRYFVGKEQMASSPISYNQGIRKSLWEMSEKTTGMFYQDT